MLNKKKMKMLNVCIEFGSGSSVDGDSMRLLQMTKLRLRELMCSLIAKQLGVGG